MTPTKKDKSYASRTQERVNGQLVWRNTRWAMYDSPIQFAEAYAGRIKRLWKGAVGASSLDEYINGLSPYGDGRRGNYFTESRANYKARMGNILRTLTKA